MELLTTRFPLVNLVVKTVQETKEIDNSKHLVTQQSEKAIDLVRKTGMARLCFPRRSKAEAKNPTGLQSSKVNINGEKLVGSEVMSWAMSRDGQTKLHFDMQEAGDRLFFSAAVGTIRAVRTEDRSLPFAKQAIMVCAQDREKVVTEFGLRLRESGHCQYSGHMDLESLAGRLGKIGARFVVMNFPPGSSYLLPPECAHMFANACLTEGSGWYPCIREYGEVVLMQEEG